MSARDAGKGLLLLFCLTLAAVSSTGTLLRMARHYSGTGVAWLFRLQDTFQKMKSCIAAALPVLFLEIYKFLVYEHGLRCLWS